MMQTLANRLIKKNFDSVYFDLCMIDEAQHFESSTWRAVHDNLTKRNSSMLTVALSATPWRYDGSGFDDTFEVLILGPQPGELIESGDLVPMAVFQVPFEVFEAVAVVENEFSQKDQETKIIESFIFGNVLETYRAYIDGAPTIAFTPTVKVAEMFAETFTKAGYPSFAVSAGTAPELREAYFAGLETGKTCVLFNVDIATEGVDIPSVACVMDLAKTMSLTRFIQRTGRGMRPAPGKKCGIYLDFCGNSHIHGDPCQNRDWTLTGVKNNKKEKNKVILSQCPNELCGYATSGRPKLCPFCGAEMKEAGGERRIKYVDAQLIQAKTNFDYKAVRDTVRFYQDIRKIENEIPHILKNDDRDIRKTIEELTQKMGLEKDFLNQVYESIMLRKKAL
jgi:superfamily II DNA or RNA helicase